MKEHIEFLKTLNKRVKKMDQTLAPSRKRGVNEFANIKLYTTHDNTGLCYGRDSLLDVRVFWDNPTVTHCNETNSIITRPRYSFHETDKGNYPSHDWIEWRPSFYHSDLKKDGNHRPLQIVLQLRETSANHVFIYTKKELERAQKEFRTFPIALKQMELGSKYAYDESGKILKDWLGELIEVPRLLGDEIEALKDDDLIFIVGDGWDQSDTFEIKDFFTREVTPDKNLREKQSIFYTQHLTDEEFIKDLLTSLVELDNSNKLVLLGDY